MSEARLPMHSMSAIQDMMRRRAFQGLHERGRHCTEPGCITILCIWNPGPLCYWHTAEQKRAERERRFTPSADQQAEQEEREMEELLRTPPTFRVGIPFAA